MKLNMALFSIIIEEWKWILFILGVSKGYENCVKIAWKNLEYGRWLVNYVY